METILFFIPHVGTYIPRKEVAVLETIKATVIRENQAIRLRARKEGVDRGGVRRVTGEHRSYLSILLVPGLHSETVSAPSLVSRQLQQTVSLIVFQVRSGWSVRWGRTFQVPMKKSSTS